MEKMRPTGSGMTAGDRGRFIPRLDRRMPVEIMKDFDTVLLFGRLAKVSMAGLMTVEHIPGEARFPLTAEGGSVLIRGYDGQMDPILFHGRVLYASRLEYTVGELKPIPYRTPRKRARCPMFPPVDTDVLDGTAPDRPQPCRLLNISLGGACIVAEHAYPVGQALCLRIGQANAVERTAYHCKVVRAAPRREGWFEYGLSFVHLSRGQRLRLAQDIRARQEELGKKLLF